MNYYKQVITDPKNKRYLEAVAICRMDLSPGNVITERFDPDTETWFHDPNVLGSASGMSGGSDFIEISQSIANQIRSKLCQTIKN